MERLIMDLIMEHTTVILAVLSSFTTISGLPASPILQWHGPGDIIISPGVAASRTATTQCSSSGLSKSDSPPATAPSERAVV